MSKEKTPNIENIDDDESSKEVKVKEITYIGLTNQGVTDYFNCLIHAFYHIGALRKAIYQIPTQSDVPKLSVPLALQRIFYRLQFGDKPVHTNELTESFGWSLKDSFIQHHIQEFYRILCDILEEKMKGTEVEGTIKKIFGGKIKSFIKCIDVVYESSRVEDFFDLCLTVKGNKTLFDSFEQLVETEILEGYRTPKHRDQKIRKGEIFLSFPPVLMLHLKRFEFDLENFGVYKVNDHYEFPEILNLDRFLSEDAEKKELPIYHLHGVISHTGLAGGGHHFIFIKPTTKPHWYQFDDTHVSKVSLERVFPENFGGEMEVAHRSGTNTIVVPRCSNALALIYYRSSDMHDTMAPVLDTDIPSHIKENAF